MKSYTELSQLPTFESRFDYLKMPKAVGFETFGSHRYINQRFYTSQLWKSTRDKVIIRDNGCDLACPGHEIYGRIYIHHINPITEDDLIHGDEDILLNPDNLICVSFETHNAIHYGTIDYARELKMIERKPGDTILW